MIEISQYFKKEKKDVKLDYFIKAVLDQIRGKNLGKVSKAILEITINNYFLDNEDLLKLRQKRFGAIGIENNSFYFYEYFHNNKKPFKHVVEFSR